jgi:hypothetical protein
MDLRKQHKQILDNRALKIKPFGENCAFYISKLAVREHFPGFRRVRNAVRGYDEPKSLITDLAFEKRASRHNGSIS